LTLPNRVGRGLRSDLWPSRGARNRRRCRRGRPASTNSGTHPMHETSGSSYSSNSALGRRGGCSARIQLPTYCAPIDRFDQTDARPLRRRAPILPDAPLFFCVDAREEAELLSQIERMQYSLAMGRSLRRLRWARRKGVAR
jgi:hypothetical protein